MVFSKGSIIAIAVYFLIFIYFPNLFGETAVNVLGLGGKNGGTNLMFNLFFYAIMTFVITVIVGLFFLINVNGYSQI